MQMSKSGLGKTTQAVHPFTWRQGRDGSEHHGQETGRGSNSSSPRKIMPWKKDAQCCHIFPGLQKQKMYFKYLNFKILTTKLIIHNTVQTKQNICALVACGPPLYHAFCHLPSRQHKNFSFHYILVGFYGKQNNLFSKKCCQLYFDLVWQFTSPARQFSCQ